MPVAVVTPPEPVVTWDDLKAHLRLDVDVERSYVEGLAAAATGWVDGPAGWLGRAIGVQTLEFRGACWPCALPFPPAIEIVSANVGGSAVEGAVVEPDGILTRPDGLPSGAVVIRYQAGYRQVPAPIKVAIMLLVGAWYENREETVIGVSVSALPSHVGAEALLQPYRVYR